MAESRGVTYVESVVAGTTPRQLYHAMDWTFASIYSATAGVSYSTRQGAAGQSGVAAISIYTPTILILAPGTELFVYATADGISVNFAATPIGAMFDEFADKLATSFVNLLTKSKSMRRVHKIKQQNGKDKLIIKMPKFVALRDQIKVDTA